MICNIPYMHTQTIMRNVQKKKKKIQGKTWVKNFLANYTPNNTVFFQQAIIPISYKIIKSYYSLAVKRSIDGLTILMARQNIDTLAALGRPPGMGILKGRRVGIVKHKISTREVEILMRK